MGFSITIQVDENSSMYLSNGYGDFSVGPLGRLARKYQSTGFHLKSNGAIGCLIIQTIWIEIGGW